MAATAASSRSAMWLSPQMTVPTTRAGVAEGGLERAPGPHRLGRIETPTSARSSPPIPAKNWFR